jgi:hypothetical protein
MLGQFFRPETLIFFIPIVAIVGGFLSTIIQQWIKHAERMAELKCSQVNTKIDEPALDSLRKEISQVRSVATEYDLSIQHTLDQIQQRLDFLESQVPERRSYSGPAVSKPSEEQIVLHARTSSE